MTLRYHVVVGTSHDHCAEMCPLFGLDPMTDEWTDEVVGWACTECWEQFFS